MIENFTPIEFRDGEWRPHYKSKAYPMWSYYRSHDSRLTSAKKRYDSGYKNKCAKYYQDNREQKLQNSREWDLAHPGYRSQYMKDRRKKNPGKVRTEEILKELKRKQRFIYKHLLVELEIIYSNCPINYVVDHIVPLQGKLVSGLHVPWNLQYLIPEQNNFKRAKFDGTYNNENWKEKYNEYY